MRQCTVTHVEIGHALKRKPERGHCFRQTIFFQSSDKKATCLTRTQTKILGIPRNRELNWTFLPIFSERHIFYTLK